VADQGRVDVLVQVRVDLDGGGVQPGLVREGGDADVGLVGGRGDVGDLGDGLGDPGHLAQAALGQHAAAVLEDQGGDHREQVGVADPFAVPVGGALHVGGARVDGGQRVGHRAAGVVLGVDAQPRPGGLADLGDDLEDVGGQHAAVGVAQHDHGGPRL